MEKLSVFLITKNEEERLAATLTAAKEVADEILILDSGSTDQTEQIAKDFNAVFKFREFDGFGQQKHAAQELCSYNWILNLDADEVLSDDLIQEIKAFLSDKEKTSSYDGGEMAIVSVLPNEQAPRPLARSYDRIRFYNKTKLSFPLHSTFDNIDRKPDYKIHEFKGIVLHYSYLSLEALEKKARERTKFYFESEKKGKFIKNLIRLPFEYIWSFIKAYFLRGHFASGLYGLKNAMIYAKYRHLRIAQRVFNRCLIRD